MAGNQPIFILREDTSRETGRSAQKNNIAAAKAIADAVRSTLGPKGMDKMLVDTLGDVMVTNDGVSILKEIDVEHPAAKMLIETAKVQDQECGDGTTSAVIFCGELLRNAEELIEQKIHPTIICEGYRMACEKALEVIKKIAIPINKDRDTLIRIAKTAMTGKNGEHVKDHLSNISLDAVLRVVDETGDSPRVNIDNIKIIKKQGGKISDTSLIEGVIIDKERVHSGMPASINDAKIALVNSAFEVKKTEVSSNIKITDPSQLKMFLDQEENMFREMVDAVVSSGANVVFCQKGIDDLPQHFLAKNGIYSVRRVSKSDMTKLAKATGGRIVSDTKTITPEDLGKAKRVYEKKISNEDMTFITGCSDAKAVTILIRGATEHVVDELERVLNDALNVVAVALEDNNMLAGGGSSSIEINRELTNFAPSVGGRAQMAVEAFARAMEVIPKALAANSGLDSIDTLLKLRKAHSDGNIRAGLNVFTGEVENMQEKNVLEPSRVVKQAITGATETAVMILRIDDVIAARRGGGGGPGGMPDYGED